MARPSAAQLRARREFVRRFGNRRRNPRAHRRRKIHRLRSFVKDRGPWAPSYYFLPRTGTKRSKRRLGRAVGAPRFNPDGGGGGMLVLLGLGAFLLWSWSRSRLSSANPVPMPAGGCPPGSISFGIAAVQGQPGGIMCAPMGPPTTLPPNLEGSPFIGYM